MNKLEVADAIYKKLNIKQFEAYGFIDLLVSVLIETLQAGEKVMIANFGTFRVVQRRSKKVVEPFSKKKMVIPAQKVVKFMPAPKLKNLIRN